MRHITRPYGRRISCITDGQDAIRTDSAQSIRMDSPCIDTDGATRHIEARLRIDMSQRLQIDYAIRFLFAFRLYADSISSSIGCLYMKGAILG